VDNPSPDNGFLVFVTSGSREEATRIAEALVGERLAACVSVLPGVRSTYRWRGTIHRDDEVLLIAKTAGARVEAVRARVRALHSYETPEIAAIPIAAADPDWLAWLRVESAS